jgi:hypothetical protein
MYTSAKDIHEIYMCCSSCFSLSNLASGAPKSNYGKCKPRENVTNGANTVAVCATAKYAHEGE